MTVQLSWDFDIACNQSCFTQLNSLLARFKSLTKLTLEVCEDSEEPNQINHITQICHQPQVSIVQYLNLKINKDLINDEQVLKLCAYIQKFKHLGVLKLCFKECPNITDELVPCLSEELKQHHSLVKLVLKLECCSSITSQVKNFASVDEALGLDVKVVYKPFFKAFLSQYSCVSDVTSIVKQKV